MHGCIVLALLSLAGTRAPAVDLCAHPAGLWSLPEARDTERWVEIHNLDEARTSGIFHIEVLARRRGDPTWNVQHLTPHLAITRAALERSVVKPLNRGAVYPESFDSAYQVWVARERAGRHPFVCDSSVDECLKVASIGEAAPEPAAADFAVRVVYGQCWYETIDTATQTFSRVIREGVVETAHFTLSKAQREQVYAMVSSVPVFDYPDRFEPPVDGEVEPAADFTIELQNGGRRHIVQWIDHGSESVDATRLRAMLLDVRAFFVALPMVRRLPASQFICL